MTNATGSGRSGDIAYQKAVLPDVSRSFALTIPQLPDPLEHVVANAYLLCRIADTIEDEPALDAGSKRDLHGRLVAVVAQPDAAERFAGEAAAALSSGTSEAERELVRNTARVLRITSGFAEADRHAIASCIEKMCRGMRRYETEQQIEGLSDLTEFDRYCYYVAGVVGEMLTELFCNYSPAIARRRSEMMRLAWSFGEGLQMTNILKDVWEDRAEGRCWLPRDRFAAAGYDLRRLAPDHDRGAFADGLNEMIGFAHGHLRNALAYTLCIPAKETGIRRFCFWSVGLALLTLRKLKRNPGYRNSESVKVSRRGLALVVVASSLGCRMDMALKGLFELCSRGLPLYEIELGRYWAACEGVAGNIAAEES